MGRSFSRTSLEIPCFGKEYLVMAGPGGAFFTLMSFLDGERYLFSILPGGVHARVFSMSDHRWQKEEKSGLVGDNVEILKAEARQTTKSSTVKDNVGY
jgi:hypothetical protein